MRFSVAILATMTIAGGVHAQNQPQPAAPQRIAANPLYSAPTQSGPQPDEVLTYGDAISQRIEVFLPDGDGPKPVVIFISGGCYITQYGGPAQVRPILDELSRDGVAVWSVGYRRTDEDAAFPDLFNDVATAIERIKTEAPRLNLDLTRVVFVGHSAGGHFALWAAARDRLPVSSPLHRANPLKPIGVVAVAAPGDIEPLRQVATDFCGAGVFERVMGEPNEARPDIYADASPSRLLPFGIPIRLIDGTDDEVIPPVVMGMFERQASAAGDDVSFEMVADADHLDVVTPGESGWAAVRHATLMLLGLQPAD